VAIVMIVIARPAANLRSFAINQRDYRMIRDPAALDAMIVNNVSKSLFTHTRDRLMRSISGSGPARTFRVHFALNRRFIEKNDFVRLKLLRHRPGSSGVERSPEKAGVGGSIPSLATIPNSVTCKGVTAFSQRSTALQNDPAESKWSPEFVTADQRRAPAGMVAMVAIESCFTLSPQSRDDILFPYIEAPNDSMT
jgi:hypothetical protein